MREAARLGGRGEDLAADLLERLGYQVVARNWRVPSGEVDVVARRGDEVVFCEVKTRASEAWGGPAHAVGALKQLRLRRAAAEWLRAHPGRARTVRFDVVSVIVGPGPPKVQHIPDAF